MTWTNNDGLVVKFATEEATLGKGGSYEDHLAQLRITELVVDATAIPALASVASSIPDMHITIPSNHYIEKIEVIADVACTSGGSATLDFGLIRLDQSTELDYNGFVAALALTAIDTAGEFNSITKGGTGAGALIGTQLSNAGILTVNYNTAAFTAGRLRLRVYSRAYSSTT